MKADPAFTSYQTWMHRRRVYFQPVLNSSSGMLTKRLSDWVSFEAEA